MVNKLINLLVGGAGGFVGLFIAKKLAEYMANAKNETLKNNAGEISDGLLVVIALVLLMFVKNKWVELLATGIGVVGVADLVSRLISGTQNKSISGGGGTQDGSSSFGPAVLT